MELEGGGKGRCKSLCGTEGTQASLRHCEWVGLKFMPNCMGPALPSHDPIIYTQTLGGGMLGLGPVIQ